MKMNVLKDLYKFRFKKIAKHSYYQLNSAEVNGHILKIPTYFNIFSI